MADYNFNDILNAIATVSSQRKYWMVRTMGGAYYADFIRKNYIAIGYNEISLQQLNNLPQSQKQAKVALKAQFTDAYPDNRSSGHSVSQLLRFTREVRVGDIVIIPSESAMHVAIGVITSEMYEVEELDSDVDNRCQFKKRMKVDWKSFSRRKYLSPSLQMMFVSRHPISDVTSYAPYIDSKISDCYLKNDEMNLVLRITTRKDVDWDDFFNLKALTALTEQFCRTYNLNLGDDPIHMKIQMESPGSLRLSSKSSKKLLVLGLILTICFGGGIRCERIELDISTGGIPAILEAISDFRDREADRGLIETANKAMDSLKIQAPADLIEVLNIRNEIRDNY